MSPVPPLSPVVVAVFGFLAGAAFGFAVGAAVGGRRVLRVLRGGAEGPRW